MNDCALAWMVSACVLFISIAAVKGCRAVYDPASIKAVKGCKTEGPRTARADDLTPYSVILK